jgi:phage FluMu gp28-like protein
MTQTLDTFLPYQQRWIDESAPVALDQKSRRIGITWAEAFRSVERRIKLKTDHFFSAQDKDSAGEFLGYCKMFAAAANAVAEDLGEQVIDEAKGVKAFVLRFAGGQRIAALSSNPDAFRGKGGDVTLDEFAFRKDPAAAFKAARASAMVWGHRLRIISSHNGEGSLFNTLVKEIQSGKRQGWALHTTSIIDAVGDGLAERIRHLPLTPPNLELRKTFLDDLRRDCLDQSEWDQEYMCIPGSDEASLLGYDLIRGCEAPNLKLRHPSDFFVDGGYETDNPLYAGYDVARRRNFSVLWILEKIGDVFWTRCIHAITDQTFAAQEDLLNGVMANRSIKRLCIDATGMGEMLAERQVQRWGSRAEAVRFSAPVKSELYMPLVRLFEDRSVKVPATAEVREDLHKVRKTVTAAGNIRLDAANDEEGHADRTSALALAYHAGDAVKLPLPPPLLRKPAGW